MFKKEFVNIYEKIKQAKNIILTIHSKPDGDALGSAGILAEICNNLKKNFLIFCPDLVNQQFKFLPYIDKIIKDKKQFKFLAYDLIIALDCGSLKRTNLEQEIISKNKNQFIIEFDHHPKIDNFANISIKNCSACATTEILYSFLKANKIKINQNLANCILTGILTDTGNFLYPNTTDKTMMIASEMLRKGANFSLINKKIWQNKNLLIMKIWGKAISNLKINKKYNFAYTILNYEDLNHDLINNDDIEGIAGFLSNLKNVKAFLLLREEKKNIFRGNLRTNHNNVDISKLANELGGGGHPKASGFSINGQLIKNKKNWKFVLD